MAFLPKTKVFDGKRYRLFDDYLKLDTAEWEAGKDSEEYTNAIIQGVKQKVKGLSSDTAEQITIQAIKIGIETGKFIQLCIKAHQENKK